MSAAASLVISTEILPSIRRALSLSRTTGVGTLPRHCLYCTDVEIKEMGKLIKSKFESIEKIFDNLENWIKWVIGFGVGAVGLSIGTMVLQALYYDKRFKNDIPLVAKEVVENSASRMKRRILLAAKNYIIQVQSRRAAEYYSLQ
ncbi:hypothetical protein HOY82DRAFT_666316 [Tuber indicum]|nr:hypothetical protein HOY82DRAFT_666316 [Tuber indicum]